ncbi:MAG: hypothetical protein Q4G37_00680, partial [Bifidobacterium sp.]|nr:hypothetical protein [Bifidobacterium sp.]
MGHHFDHLAGSQFLTKSGARREFFRLFSGQLVESISEREILRPALPDYTEAGAGMLDREATQTGDATSLLSVSRLRTATQRTK